MAMERHHSACSVSSRDLPPLSPTYQTSRLLTPDNLFRCTADPAQYREYLMNSLRMDPPDRNALSVRTQLYGDNKFFINRYTGIHQPQFRTSIPPSDSRPTDDMHSEISTPFPSQHPFTSHISKFAVFPETQSNESHLLSSYSPHPSLVSSSTQTQPTDLATYRYLMPRPIAPFYVLKKASESKERVERCHLWEESEDMLSDDRATLWDLPRSQRHMRTNTYPAPLVQCPVHPSSLSPTSREALRSIYHQVMLSTSYSEHFSPPKPSPAPKNENKWLMPTRDLPAPTSLFPLPEDQQSECHHGGCDWNKLDSDEVVDKVNSVVVEPAGRCQTGSDRIDQTSEGVAQTLSSNEAQVPLAGKEQGTLYNSHNTTHHAPSITKEEVQCCECGVQKETDSDHICGCGRIDKATQTDQSHWMLPAENHQPYGTLQTSLPQHHYTSTQSNHRSLTYPMQAQSQCLTSLCSVPQEPCLLQTPLYTPRSALVGQRMGTLLRFSKSEARKRFHALYPEKAPNLKEHKSHSENERRHVINGYNAYYYH